MLLIRIKKNSDGSGALTCLRPDGTITYQRQNPKQANFFVRHDLTHFAVETVMQHRKGFYGLIALGWDFADFAEKWDKKKYPPDADLSELIVGLFDAESGCGERWSATEFNHYAKTFMAQQGATLAGPVITDEQISKVHDKLAELLQEWSATKPGDALELKFEIAPK